MRKLFFLTSILLLFIGTALANAPPGFDNLGENQSEYTNFLPGDAFDTPCLGTDMIQFTADVQTFSLPTIENTITGLTLAIPEVVDVGYDISDIDLYAKTTLNLETKEIHKYIMDRSYLQATLERITYLVTDVPFRERGCL